MQVKTFKAADMASGLKQIRKEMGADALILSTRSVRDGKLGLLAKPTLEITAAIDSPALKQEPKIKTPDVLKVRSKKRIPSRQVASDLKNRINAYSGNINTVIDDSIEAVTYSPQKPANYSSMTTAEDSENSTIPDANNQTLHDEMQEIKSMVKALGRQVSRLNTSQTTATAIESNKTQQLLQGVQNNFLPEKSLDNPVIELLLKQGINLEASTTIADFAQETVTDELLNVPEHLISHLKTAIMPLIQTGQHIFNEATDQKRIALVGPTGVGKTTTIAKMAAKYLSEHSNSIALITIDTYRIAAVEQLRVYGEIMNLPVEVVITPQALEQALLQHKDKELILIDTAGRSPRDSICIEELSSFLLPEFNIEKHLVLSSTTRENELTHTIKQFEKLGVDQTVITKIDECHNLGVLLNLQIQNPNPISFITNGQRVPEDILIAEQHIIADLIMSNYQESIHG